MNPYAAFGAGCLLGGIGWWLQARRDRRALSERTRIVVGYLIELFARYDGGRWRPYLARSLAEKCWLLLRVSEERPHEAYLAAMLEALQLQFDLTFDGQRFHAKAPPRKDSTTSEVNTENEGEADEH